MSTPHSNLARARRWFWTLLAIAVLAMGGLYAAWGARPGPLTGAAVLASSLLMAAATVQAARILLALQGPVPLRSSKRRGRG